MTSVVEINQIHSHDYTSDLTEVFEVELISVNDDPREERPKTASHEKMRQL